MAGGFWAPKDDSCCRLASGLNMEVENPKRGTEPDQWQGDRTVTAATDRSERSSGWVEDGPIVSIQ